MANEETRNANVVISADVSGYTQGTQEATKQTNLLLASVNKLTTSLDGITKKMGKKLLIFSAADLATLTAVSVVTAKYEKQLGTLSAQAAVAGKNLNIYKKGIDEVSTSIPVARGELVQLSTQINNLGITSEAETVKIARLFSQMGAATGESAAALTQGLIELSRTMGTLANGEQGLRNFSDEVVTLSAKLGVASTDILGFAQNISPFARAANIGQKEILGLSAAFVRAGADSNAAATAFNTIIRDLVTLTQTGSPEIAKYANAVGMSIDAFKDLGSVEQFVRIIDAVTASGDKGIQMLNNMGIDGVRTAKAMAQLSQQAGGLQKVINEATGAYGNNNTAVGSEAAWNTLADQLVKSRNIMEKFTSDIGDYTVPVAKGLLEVFNNILSVVTKLSGPLLGFAGVVMGVTGALAGVAGSILSVMGPLSSLMLIMTAFRLSPIRTLFSGIGDAVNAARGTGAPLSKAGQMTAEGVRLPFYQRLPYAAGQAAGAQIGRLPQGAAAGFRTLGTLGAQTVGTFASAQSTWYDNARKPWWERQSTMFSAPDQGFSRGQVLRNALAHPGATLSGFFGRDNQLLSAARGMENTATDARMGYSAAAAGNTAYDNARAGGASAAEAQKAAIRASNSMSASMKVAAERSAEYAKNLVAAKGSQAALATAAGGAARSLVAVGAAATRMGVSVGAQALAAPFRMLGGMVGMGGGAGAAIAAVGAGAYMVKQHNDSLESTYDSTRNISAVNAFLGLQTEPLNDFKKAVTDTAYASKNLAQAMNLTTKAAYDAYSREYVDERVSALPNDRGMVVEYLKSLGPLGLEQGAVVAQDLTKRFGSQSAQAAINQYLKETDQGKNVTTGISEITNRLNPESLMAVTNQSRGWAQSLMGVMPNETKDWMNSTFGQLTDYSGKVGGRSVLLNGLMRDTGDIAQATGIQSMLDRLIESNRSATVEHGPMSDQQKDTGIQLQAFVKVLESQFGEMGLTGVDSLQARTQLMRDIADSAKGGNEGAKGFLEFMQGATTEDNFSQLLKSHPQMAYDTLSQSRIGRFMQNTPVVQSAMALGDASQDPGKIFKAVNKIADQLVKSTTSLDQAVKQTQATMSNLSPSGRDYQLLQAAQTKAIRDMSWNTTISQGSMAALGERYQANQQIIAAGGEGAQAAEQENFEITQQTREKAAQYYMFVKDFYRQRLYAAQDFARQMRYASEDAAKSMYDPFQRTSARGTQSSGMVATNLNSQLKKMRDQVKNLAVLRKRGLTEATIRNLNLTDPNLADQVQRWVDEGGSFQAGSLNKSGGQARTDAAGDIMKQTDAFKRAQEGYDITMERGIDSLKLYGEEVLGNTQTVLKKTAKLLGKLGIDSTDYLTNLSSLADEILGKLTKNPEETAVGDRKTVRQADHDLSDASTTGTGDHATTPGRRSSVPAGAYGNSVNRHDPSLIFNQNTFKSTDGVWMAVDTKKGPLVTLPNQNWEDLDDRKRKMFWEKWGLAAGGIATSPTTRVFGEAGPEAVIPLNNRGTQVLADAFRSAISMDVVKGMRTHGYSSVPSYKGESGGTVINKNTQFLGPITVQAQDPNEMARKLEQKKKMANLRKGANASI